MLDSSFRDPRGRVFERDGRVYRAIAPVAYDDFEQVTGAAAVRDLVEAGRFMGWRRLDPGEQQRLGPVPGDACCVIEHPRIPVVSYPYEWSFSLLKGAALLHLDLQLQLLESGIAFSDASAYNVQYLGPQPIFIDVLSCRRYREGELWGAHRQFCEQFLNPLLLSSRLGVGFQPWFRGSLEGITARETSRLLPVSSTLSWRVLKHVSVPAWIEGGAARSEERLTRQVRRATLPRPVYCAMLRELRRWIQEMVPSRAMKTVWSGYDESTGAGAVLAKERLVREFAERVRPQLLLDIGCNTGQYSILACGAGAMRAVGWDTDQLALCTAHERAGAAGASFLPLYMDAANPSPGQGWRGRERPGIVERLAPDALLALASVHHLAIGRNIPLDELVSTLVGLAPAGLVEFVPKSDPMVQRMLALREDIFDDYTRENFTALLSRSARVIATRELEGSLRTVYWYER